MSGSTKKIVLFSVLGVVVLLVVLVAASLLWYQSQLSPVGSRQSELVKLTIPTGTPPNSIATLLKEKGVIRSTQAFSLYTRFTNTQNKLQAGDYRLSPAESTPQIVTHLVNGNTDALTITFLPGATLAQNRTVLIKAGYSAQEVDAALAATYTTPLFDAKPLGSDLEGYIYGETYNIASNATVSAILNMTFIQYEKIIKDNNLVAKYKAQGLTLYQGITLASIIQREATSGSEAQIAQVFYLRLAQNMPLGSDVTYQYIADKTGVARDPTLESPYNTRIYKGLPPGPISVPGLASLLAVANPAPGDNLYFLSGDDGTTYYAHTLSEHEANIKAYCQKKCSTN
ncbi:MAG: endolytic transglycosylase MltG [Candidatus Microsaccharimonas sossegonensis]|uniref:Endolytic murein transglycosylase n=1 Tax=Candidatus Microsaccharimonas sossegonensis TaxID=2506948 RepID=A0A4Q0AGH7_9BACT|nr:MAG: endolytic transglycosylase MltG [Candidatus Microsaccharimonas sossegonensis]